MKSLPKSLFTLIAFLLTNICEANKTNFFNDDYLQKNNYVGIEIGAKGIKLNLINIYLKEGKKKFALLKDTTVNTNFVDLNEKSYNNSLTALTGLYSYVIEVLKIDKSKIQGFISSGVKYQMIKFGKQKFVDSFIQDFRNKINSEYFNFEIVDALIEAKYTHIGAIEDDKRFNTFLIDIGSGNTKGVYFTNSINNVKLFSLNWGTRTTTNAIEVFAQNDSSFKHFISNINFVIDGPINGSLKKSNIEFGELKQKEHFCLTGGIVWAIAILAKPNLVDKHQVNLSYNEILIFYNEFKSNYELNISNTAIVNAKYKIQNKQLLEKNISKINKAFDAKAILSGTALLLKVLKPFEKRSTQTFEFIKNAPTAWVNAYLTEKILKN